MLSNSRSLTGLESAQGAASTGETGVQRPLLNALDGGGDPISAEATLTDIRDYIREHAMTLPPSEDWRPALLGIASDISKALRLREPALPRPSQSPSPARP